MKGFVDVLVRLMRRLQYAYYGAQTRWRIYITARRVAALAKPDPSSNPVLIFNASARLGSLSQNAAFSLLSAWGLRLAGLPVIHYACRSGLSRCVLGTDRDDHTKPPPCEACVAQSRRLFAGADTSWFAYQENASLDASLEDLDLQALLDFEHEGWAYGQLVLPSLRWNLRRHHLVDDVPTRYLLRQFILSAHSLVKEYSAFLERVAPRLVVVFNGMMYPEAVVRRISRQRGIPVVTHEVAFRPFSAFFTPGEATAYPIEIPADFELSPPQDAQLDAYLEKRFQGNFTMAGIQFWPEMRGLDKPLLSAIERFKQVVPVFTNVIFDTSQVHANTLFPHMFAWLDHTLQLIKSHPETLFVIRAHPDEMRPGTKKQSRESVRQWVEDNQVRALPNVVFIDSQEYVSSYALIRRAKFVMVYNSSIGLEATLLNVPALCAGRARYTQYPTVFYPASREEYASQLEAFVEAQSVEVPPEFVHQARRFLYFQLFRTALPFERFLQAHPRPGYVRLRSFPARDLLPQNAPAIDAVYQGVASGAPFLV